MDAGRFRCFVDRLAHDADDALGGQSEPEWYWLVDDVAQAARAGRAEISLPLEERAVGKVFAVKDPDGQQRCPLEIARHRPSRQMP